jgi:predicted DNA-binding protein
MKTPNQLKVTTIMLIPEHMAQLKALAEPQGLTASALVRVAIVEYLRRAARQK